jgi:hypothetical protein
MRHEALTLTLLFIIGCGPPRPRGETDNDVTDELTQACETFCEVAIACSSDEFAKSWEFTTTTECTDDCVQFTQAATEFVDRPECEMIGTELWSCAGEITQCETFESFEKEAFNINGFVENPCWTETKTFLDECNS